jgi:hypothetical protein
MKLWIIKNETAVSIVFLLLLTVICFIPLSNQTGYYLNDWHPLAGKLNDTSLFKMWSHERYGVGLLYSITYPILGDHLFLWQIFSIGLRLISALGFWWLIRLVWNEGRYFSTTAAAIFLLYPGFMEQSIALTFSNHFIGINLAIFSIIFTIKAVQTGSRKIRFGYIAIALLFEIAYLFNYEYMLGYEVVRIVLIWYLLYRPFKFKTIWKSIKKLFVSSLPYLTGAGMFLIWRVLIFKSTRPTTNIGMLGRKYLSEPVMMIGRIFLETIRDTVETVWLGWSVPFNQFGADTAYGNFALSLLLGVSSAILLFILVKTEDYEKDDIIEISSSPINKNSLYQDSVWIGLIAIVVALLPVILSDREVKFKNQMDRYTLHAALGVGLFTAGLIFHWVKNSGRKIVVGFLLMIAVMTQYNSTVAYATWWNYQTSLWWQLAWRAPDIKDGTVIMPLLPFGNRLQEDIEVWTPANAIYRPDQPGVVIAAEVINPETALNVFFKDQTYRNFRGGIQYSRDFNQPLIVSYPSGGSCAHIIDGNRLELSLNDESIIYRVAAFSRIDQIVVDTPAHIPPKQIFGFEPEHDWCYFYQKANLARQQENWVSGVALGDEVLALGYNPQDVSEWLPFVEIYLENGQSEKAQQLVQIINNDQSATKNLCAVWKFNKPHENSQLMELVCDSVN